MNFVAKRQVVKVGAEYDYLFIEKQIDTKGLVMVLFNLIVNQTKLFLSFALAINLCCTICWSLFLEFSVIFMKNLFEDL